MSEFPGDEDTYLKNLDSFWTELFTDTPILNSMYRGAEALMAESYFTLLREAASTTLQNTPIYAREYFSVISFVESDLKLVTSAGTTFYTFLLPVGVQSVAFIKDRPLDENTILENDRDYTVSDVTTIILPGAPLEATRRLISFSANPFDIEGVATTIETLTSNTLNAATDGFVSGGRPPTHITSSSLDQNTLLNSRNSTRRTFTTLGIVASRRTSTFYQGNISWLEAPSPVFSVEHVGLTIRVYDSGGLIGTGKVTGVFSSRVVTTDTSYVTLDPTVSFELVNPDLLSSTVGYEIVIQDSYNPANSGIYTVSSVTNGLSVVLDRPLSYLSTALQTQTLCTRVGSIVSILTGLTRVTLNDVGNYIFLSDQIGATGWFQIVTVTSPNVDNFMQVITVAESLAAFDLFNLVLSIHRIPVQSANIGWILRTPANARKISLVGVDVLYDDLSLASKYGVLLGKEEVSSLTYKTLLEGVSQYYWKGPTIKTLYSALNSMASLPIVKEDKETLVSLVDNSGVTTVTTSLNTYILPTALVRDDLLLPENSSYKFYKLEHLSKAIILEDDYIDETWLYGKKLPTKTLPLATEAQRRVDTRQYVTTFNGSWNYGDIGVNFGKSTAGAIYPNTILNYQDAFLVAGSTDTLFFSLGASKITPSLIGKTVYINGEQNSIKAVLSDTQLTLTNPLDTTYIASLTGDGFMFGNQLIFLPANKLILDKKYIGGIVRWVEGLGTGLNVIDSLIWDSTSGFYVSNVDGTAANHPIRIVTFDMSIPVVILNKPPTHLTLGTTTASLVSSNIFGVSYDLTDLSIDSVNLQADISDIVVKGRPAHTLLLNQPFALLSDLASFSDDLRSLSVLPEELFRVMSNPLTMNGGWVYGDSYTLVNGYITWNKRYFGPEVLNTVALPTNPFDANGLILHRAFDATYATEVYVSAYLKSGGVAGVYTLEVMLWDSGANIWLATGIIKSVSNAAGSPITMFNTGGAPIAFKLTPVGAAVISDVCLAVGARRALGIFVTHSAYTLSGSAGSIILGNNVMTDAASTFFDLDVGREISLTYPGSPEVYDSCRIVSIPSPTSVRLVFSSSNLDYTAPMTSGIISWKFRAQRRWGQTPVEIGYTLTPSVHNPTGTVAGDNFIEELPVEVSLFDT